MSGLTEDSWILISASVSNLLQYVVLVEVYEENPDSQRYVLIIGKERTSCTSPGSSDKILRTVHLGVYLNTFKNLSILFLVGKKSDKYSF